MVRGGACACIGWLDPASDNMDSDDTIIERQAKPRGIHLGQQPDQAKGIMYDVKIIANNQGNDFKVLLYAIVRNSTCITNWMS